MVLDTIVSGWTGRLGPFTLLLNDAPFDLTGFSVEIVLHAPRNLQVTPRGTLITNGQGLTTGQVAYDPDPLDFVNARSTAVVYRVHFRVTDSQGKKVNFPNGEAYEIVVAAA